MEEKLIDLNEVARMMSVHPKSARKIIKNDDEFPDPIVFSQRVKRWKYSSVIKWIERKDEANV
tara:strand:+ start:476 stop:664 length:189 start_codon:yes stop_codon:yes gene_type:complete